jgi:hypothetical protein
LKGLPFRKGLTTGSFFEGLTGVSVFFFNVIPPENKLFLLTTTVTAKTIPYFRRLNYRKKEPGRRTE